MTNSIDNYQGMLLERAELWEAKKEIEEKIKTLDAELRPILYEKGDIVVGDYLFNVTSVAGRTLYDTKLMLTELGTETMEKYKKTGAPSTKFAIKKINVTT